MNDTATAARLFITIIAVRFGFVLDIKGDAVEARQIADLGAAEAAEVAARLIFEGAAAGADVKLRTERGFLAWKKLPNIEGADDLATEIFGTIAPAYR